MENLYLPKDTFDRTLNKIDNFALRLNKFPPTYEKYDRKTKEMKTEFALNHHEKKKNIHCEVKLDFQDSQKQILEFSAKYLFSLQQVPEQNLEISAFKPDWRLIIGLGSASVYETSITLHHIYGFPYIPGQAVKGITRNYVICEHFEKDEEKAEKNRVFKAIFGSQEQKGKVIFFDAYPQTEPKLDFDIMNVHYPKYYSGQEEPTDDQNPNPITFLTVKDTTFFFPIGFPKSHQKANFTIKGNTISELIKNALEEKGIGAKSSVGYGYLKESKENDSIFVKKQKRLKEQKDAVLEAAKPEYQKLSENLKHPYTEAFQFLDNENPISEKKQLISKMKNHFQNKDFWKKEEKLGHQYNLANSAFKFLIKIEEKDEIILDQIQKYGGKKLKKKLKKWR